jgi:hypothetical protein
MRAEISLASPAEELVISTEGRDPCIEQQEISHSIEMTSSTMHLADKEKEGEYAV